jgi:hypothetical protein
MLRQKCTAPHVIPAHMLSNGHGRAPSLTHTREHRRGSVRGDQDEPGVGSNDNEFFKVPPPFWPTTFRGVGIGV